LKGELQKLDIRVGRIVSIELNSESDLLFNSVVDIGHGNTLNILLGLRGKIKKEDLED
jgi:tRNA-binding EMAP/Myf-like protein